MSRGDRVAMHPIDRLLTKARYEPDTHCWIGGHVRNKDGYVLLTVGSRKDGTRRRTSAHRISYLCFKGAIPPEKEIDHLCFNRACFNPSHLEAVTTSENVLRAVPRRPKFKVTRCRNGHEYTPETTLKYGKHPRHCKVCHYAAQRRWRQKRGAR